ncbi:MAG: lactonase family protein, partial [Deltaproteobacteria bacterium]|nr:lactonase family protein [Deltaproteobacteria bacterium]
MLRACTLLLVAAACGGDPAASDAGPGDSQPEDAAVDAAIPSKLVAYVSGGTHIAWYDVDRATGALHPISTVVAVRGPASFLAHRGSTLYAVAESDNRVGAYAVAPATGALTFINDVAAGGTGPTHVSVDATGRHVFVANYSNGTVSVFPVQAGGGLGAAAQTLTPGANAHMIAPDPTNRSVFVPCLGANIVAQYRFEPTTGVLTPSTPASVATASGAGPRHIAFAPDGMFAYVINELDSTMSAFTLDPATGRLTSIQTLSTRAAGATGTNTTAEVVVHPTGKYLYGSNRGDNTVV